MKGALRALAGRSALALPLGTGMLPVCAFTSHRTSGHGCLTPSLQREGAVFWAFTGWPPPTSRLPARGQAARWHQWTGGF